VAIDFTTPAGQLRLLIADTDEANPVLDDPSVNGFLALNRGVVRRAAADALDAIASSEALISKVIKTADLSTDGAKVADSLRAHADRLRAQSEDEDDFAFDIVDYDPNAGGYRRAEYPVWGL